MGILAAEAGKWPPVKWLMKSAHYDKLQFGRNYLNIFFVDVHVLPCP